MSGTISRSSTDSSIAYLQDVWNSRFSLNEHERLGFAQFLYIFMNTYVESQLFTLIDLRLESIKEFAQTASHDLSYRLVHTQCENGNRHTAKYFSFIGNGFTRSAP